MPKKPFRADHHALGGNRENILIIYSSSVRSLLVRPGAPNVEIIFGRLNGVTHNHTQTDPK